MLLFMLCSLNLSASVYLRNEALSINVSEITMGELFKQIEQQSDYRFYYNEASVNTDKILSINVSDQKIDRVLDLMLVDTDLTYKILENNLIVVKILDAAKESAKQGKAIKLK